MQRKCRKTDSGAENSNGPFGRRKLRGNTVWRKKPNKLRVSGGIWCRENTGEWWHLAQRKHRNHAVRSRKHRNDAVRHRENIGTTPLGAENRNDDIRCRENTGTML